MTFTFVVAGSPSPSLSALCDQLDAELRELGWTRVESSDDAKLVFNLVDTAHPRPFRRHARGTYAATLYDGPADDAPPASRAGAAEDAGPPPSGRSLPPGVRTRFLRTSTVTVFDRPCGKL